MKKKLLISVLCIFFAFSPIFAQQKLFSIKDATIGQFRHLAPENLYGLQWRTETDFYTYSDGTALSQNHFAKNQETTLINASEINSALKIAGIPEISFFPYYDYTWVNKDVIRFQSENFIIFYNITQKKLEKNFRLDENAANVTIGPLNNAVAFTIENNLFVSKGNEIVQITADQNKGIVNGDAYVHRQEFGINKGIFWSPDEKFVAFYRKDETMVTEYPIIKLHHTPADVQMIKYPMAGAKSEEVTLGVYELSTKNTVFMQTGSPKEQYLTAITWHPAQAVIYIGLLNREQNHLSLRAYNAINGQEVKLLFEEKNPIYVEPENPMFFNPVAKEQFVWLSEKDGFNHLYLYDTSGKQLAQLTSGNWMVTEFLGFDPKGQNVYFYATKESPLENHLYSVNIGNNKITHLTPNIGVHQVVLNETKNKFIDVYSNINEPNSIIIADNNAKKLKDVLLAANPLIDYNMPKMELGTIKAADGKTDLHYRLIKPINFDATKKYPAIVYVYGGPHAQLVTNNWLGGARLWDFYMAQNGYVVFTVDNRGSANRGFAFESVIHRKVGQNEMLDQMKGIDFLKNTGFVDMEKIGIHGWSFGGFMTTSLMLNYAGTFKVGVAGGPVMDWKYYEIMYGERYMDTPEENPEGYELTSCLNKTDSLKGDLFLIHGLVDPVVVPQHSLEFQNECVKTMKYPKLFFYGDHEHNVRGMDRVHLLDMISNYFFENLK